MVEVGTAPESPVTGPRGAPGAAPPPPRRGGPGLRPALIVVGLALVIISLFGAGSALFGSSTPSATSPAGPPRTVRGTTLRAVPAAPALGPIIDAGSPPANVIASLSVPAGARPGATIDHSADAGPYDKARRFEISGSEEAVIDFYRAELPAAGWHVSSVGPATGQSGIEILAEEAGDDGWPWEAGVVISPTTFATSSTGTTAFTLRLFQVPDGN